MNHEPAVGLSRLKRRILLCGVVLGICMVIVPFFASAIAIARASRVPGGLRGATHIPAMQSRVGLALGSASLMAILAPPGVLLAGFSALALASHRKAASRNSPKSRA